MYKKFKFEILNGRIQQRIFRSLKMKVRKPHLTWKY